MWMNSTWMRREAFIWKRRIPWFILMDSITVLGSIWADLAIRSVKSRQKRRKNDRMIQEI